MKEYLIELKPRSSFEIQLHADTIFGAICWGIRTLFGETTLHKELLSQFNDSPESPPFLISSAFPCRPDRGEYYFPKPLLKPLTSEQLYTLAQKYSTYDRPYHSSKKTLMDIGVKYKEFRKIRWIQYYNILKKQTKMISEFSLFIDYLDNIAAEPRYSVTEAIQKNSLDRLSNSTGGSGNTFYNEESACKETWSLYFLIKTDNLSKFILNSLKFLEDSGIGRNSKTGKNWFFINVKESPFSATNDGTHFITLSRYIKNESLQLDKSFYSLIPVRSKVESREEFAGENVWKNRVMYFQAGSVLYPETKKDCYGALIPVKDIKKKIIYQYGYAYPFWINAEVNNEI